ncbi:MAG: type II methionyl aminopeptidase [Candidatus Thermoplasmatota archaeon]|nr:type II methionyl aminopeptidase [Candidatus Thermoplasmatota archaeon]
MDKEIVGKYRKAGKIAGEAREYGISLVKENTLLLDVAEKIEKYIIEKGAKPAFPVNIGINDVAAHYTPRHDDKSFFRKGDVVKIDVGAHVDGYIGDTAGTVEVGTNRYKNMIKASKEALSVAVELIKPDVGLSVVGAGIETTIRSYNFVSVENLTGHSLKQYRLHAGKSVPNISNDVKEKIKKDDVLAVEPFATNGAGRVGGRIMGNIYRLAMDREPGTENSKKLLKYVKENFGVLPFAERWCRDKVDNAEIVLRKLMRAMIITGYPVLREINKGIVTQAEHTVIVTENGCEVIT